MYNDEIIADSEDEDELFGPYRAVPAVDSTTTITTISADSTSKSAAEASTISEFTTSKATASDTISNLSLVAPNALANPSITSVTTTTANTSRPRPKPKPIVKKPNISTTGDSPGKASSSTSNIEMFDMTLSIADRAKMRKRGNDNRDSSSSSGPGFRPDIIELSSSEDELALPAPKKLKKTVKKTTEKFTSSTRNVIRLDSPKSDLISSSFSLPTVTSPVLPRNGNRNRASSILPPSDPPQSTPSDIFDLPAIEILPNPSSSASASASYVSRAHRPHVDMSTDLDAPPPPLPFFADPSSSPFMMDKNSNTNLDAGNPHTVEGASKILHSVLMPPPPIPPSPGLPPTAQPRAKKPGTKRKKMSDEDEFMLDTEDWADTEPKGKGKKARSKRKEKAQDKRTTSKEKGKSSPQAKGKGKEKEAPPQDSFKSRELLEGEDDDDRDINELLMATITTATTSNAFVLVPQLHRGSPGSKRDRNSSDFDRQGDGLAEENEGQMQVPRKKMRRSDDGNLHSAANADDEMVELHLDSGMDIYVDSSKSASSAKKGRNTRVVMSEDEDEDQVVEEEKVAATTKLKAKPTKSKTKPKSKSSANKRVVSEDEDEDNDNGPRLSAKENILPIPQTPTHITDSSSKATITPETGKQLKYPTLASRYTIAPKSARKSTPMSDLIRRVNSMPNSQFKSPMPKGARDVTTPTYSPYLKSSRSFLSKIAPLHPNRRTPPPLPPAPPPRKKSRKEIEWEKKDKEEREEWEERWEEELVERVGGMGEWLSMGEEARKAMKRAKRDRELGLGGWEE